MTNTLKKHNTSAERAGRRGAASAAPVARLLVRELGLLDERVPGLGTVGSSPPALCNIIWHDNI